MGTADGIKQIVEHTAAGLAAEDLMDQWQRAGYEPAVVSKVFNAPTPECKPNTFRLTLEFEPHDAAAMDRDGVTD